MLKKENICIDNKMRNFPIFEFENRLRKLRYEMKKNNIDIILITEQANFHYFTGFVSQFWESPTRPIYLLISKYDEIVIIPSIMYETIQKTYIKKILTWSGPCSEDDGVSLLKEQFKGYKKVGMSMNIESQLRMPLIHLLEIKKELDFELIDISHIIQGLRLIKSEYEIDKIRTACQITSKCFAELPERLEKFDYLTERIAVKEMKLLLLENGIDDIRYMVCRSGQKGYNSIVDGPTDEILEANDIFAIDTGAVYDGYFCDFDRNYIILDKTNINLDILVLYETGNNLLWQATENVLKIAKPGLKICDLWSTMANYLVGNGKEFNAKIEDYRNGRLGHSLGLQLTELPSIKHNEETILVEGMVLCIEPFLSIGQKSIVHEECIVITDYGCELLTNRCPKETWTIKNSMDFDDDLIEIIGPLPKKNSLRKETVELLNDFSSKIDECKEIHADIPETPLLRMNKLEEELGIKEIIVKDEGKRLNLKSFKPLGAYYAINTLDPRPEVLCTMTDGNHGKGVAYVAKSLGMEAIIYVPDNMVSARIRAMMDLGAKVRVVDGSYDDAIVRVRDEAQKNGWFLISDTSWSGYTDIPKKITIGYSTIFREINEQRNGSNPITHVIIQAGVGGLAGTCGLWLLYNKQYLIEQKIWSEDVKFIIVEPKDADCIAYNVMVHGNSDDEELYKCPGRTNSMMAGLNCGVPSKLSWPVMQDTCDLYLVIGEKWPVKAMKLMHDEKIIAGESGAAGIAGLLALYSKGYFDENSVILTINTESDTDPENYIKIIKNN